MFKHILVLSVLLPIASFTMQAPQPLGLVPSANVDYDDGSETNTEADSDASGLQDADSAESK